MKIDRPITTGITLFVILLLVFFFVVPEYNRLKSLQQELGEKRAEYNAKFEYYNIIATAYNELQEYEEDIQKIDDALPSESSLGRLVYFIQKRGSESGMIIKSLFLSKSSSSIRNGIKDVTFSLNLLGGYKSLGNFIRSLERSSRLFEITKISFNSGVGNSPARRRPETQFQTQQIYSFNLEIKTRSY